MGSIVNKVTDSLGLTDSEAAARSTAAGYDAMLSGYGEGLDYLKEADAMPRQFREQAMQQLADIFGFGKKGAQGKFFGNITNDPFYKMLSQGADESYLRGQSATGDLRGGGSISGLADIENKNRMLAFQNRLEGIQSLMGLPDYTSAIYGGMTGIGEAAGQELIGVGQAQQQAEQGGFNNLLGIGKMAAGFFWNPLEK